MNKTNAVTFAFSKLFKKFLEKLGIKTTIRMLFFIFTLFALLVSGVVVALDKIGSNHFFTTTFTATIETQKLSIRVGNVNAVVSGISGKKISLQPLNKTPSGTDGEPDDFTFDLMATDEISEEINDNFVIQTNTDTAYIELDEMLVPAGRAVDIVTGGKNQTLVIEIDAAFGEKPLETRLVWNGLSEEDLTLHKNALLRPLGAKTWSSSGIKLRVERANISKLLSAPISLKNVKFENNFVDSNGSTSISAIIGGRVEFYIGGRSILRNELREGEFVRFTNLNAQLTNIRLTERGVAFVIVGETDMVQLGFLNSLRDVWPSLLNGVLASQSINIIGSAIFGISLAFLGIISMSQSDAKIGASVEDELSDHVDSGVNGESEVETKTEDVDNRGNELESGE